MGQGSLALVELALEEGNALAEVAVLVLLHAQLPLQRLQLVLHLAQLPLQITLELQFLRVPAIPVKRIKPLSFARTPSHAGAA